MSDLEADLVALLEPTLRRLVAAEIKRAQLEWRWRTIAQAAELLGVSEKAIYSRIERRQLPARKLGNRLFVDISELDRQLRQHGP